jgi:glyoxylase-like metal-dependent hydrolase (beta-lactamase superfamily II)
MDSKFFFTKEIAPKTTLIGGLGNELCYLLEGKDRALLIDALTGAGNLRAFCRELTDLPITLVNTHGHLDHAGGNFDFGECYIHPDDIPLIYQIEKNSRMGFVQSQLKISSRNVFLTENDFTDSRSIKTLPVTDGCIFEMGDRTIEVIAVPGHTRGTIVLLDRGARLLFSGDAYNINTLLFLPHSTSIEEYRESLLHLKTFQSYFDVM